MPTTWLELDRANMLCGAYVLSHAQGACVIDVGRVAHSSKAAELEASRELKHRLLAV